MNFDKKKIAGFIFSFIATVLGIVTIFFPDIFNLQKQNIEQYTGIIQSQKDVLNAMSFLNKKVKDKKVFKLNLLFCGEIKEGYAEIENKIKDLNTDIPENFDKARFEFGLTDWTNNTKEYDNHQLCQSYAWCHLKEPDTLAPFYLVPFYTFPIAIYKNLDNDTPDALRTECKSGYAYALIDGYAYYKDMNPSQDMVYWVNFNEIPEKEIIKNNL